MPGVWVAFRDSRDEQRWPQSKSNELPKWPVTHRKQLRRSAFFRYLPRSAPMSDALSVMNEGGVPMPWAAKADHRVAKGLPSTAVMAQNGPDGYAEHSMSSLCVLRSGRRCDGS